MAICATVDVSGVVHAAGSIPLAQCTDFVLLDQADWIQNGMVQGLLTIPSGDDFGALWAAGFVTPMAVGLVAWSVAVIIGIFSPKRD